MKTLATLMLMAAFCLASYEFGKRKLIKENIVRVANRPLSRKMEIQQVHHKVDPITEAALDKLGLSLGKSVTIIADVVGFQTPPHYDCQLSGYIHKNNALVHVVMSFQLEGNLTISKLRINKEVIPLPENIHGIPLGKDGTMENFDLVVYPGAYNDFTNNGEIGNGYIHEDVVKAGRIKVILKRDGMLVFN